jgi:hypothetical protein
LDELFAHVVPHLGGGTRVPRDFPASEDARTCIQMLTAAVLQMIQGCVDLPPMDCPAERLADCYKGAATCADYFWMLCFDRWRLGCAGLPAGRLLPCPAPCRAVLESQRRQMAQHGIC